MRVYRHNAVQAHYVPKHVHAPQGPFPPEMRGFNPRRADLSVMGADLGDLEEWEEDAHPAAQPEVVTDYEPEMPEDGANFEMGATAQNNFRAPKRYRCRECSATLFEDELDAHDCEE